MLTIITKTTVLGQALLRVLARRRANSEVKKNLNDVEKNLKILSRPTSLENTKNEMFTASQEESEDFDDSLLMKNTTFANFDFNKPETYPAAFTGTSHLFLILPMDESTFNESKFKALANCIANFEPIKRVVLIQGYQPKISSDPNKSINMWTNAFKSAFLKASSAVGCDGNCLLYENPENRREVHFLQPNWFMDNFEKHENLKAMVTKERKIKIPDNKQKLSFIDANDIAECGLELLMKKEGYEKNTSLSHDFAFPNENLDEDTKHVLYFREYGITGPEALGHEEVAGIFSEELGKMVRYEEVVEDKDSDPDNADINDNAGSAAHIEKNTIIPIDFIECLYKDIRSGNMAPVCGDVEKILGRKGGTFKEYVVRNKDKWLYEIE